MQIVILLLLVVALALLILGLVGNAPALVVASIVASALTVYVVARARRRRAESKPAEAKPAESTPEKAKPEEAQPEEAVPVVSEQAASAPAAAGFDEAGSEEPESEEPADEPAAAISVPPVADHGDEPVWVIDGRPRYHRWACEFVAKHKSESVPLSQAVADGFTACALCDPDTALTAG